MSYICMYVTCMDVWWRKLFWPRQAFYVISFSSWFDILHIISVIWWDEIKIWFQTCFKWPKPDCEWQKLKKKKLELEASQQAEKRRKLTFSSIQWQNVNTETQITPNLTNALPGLDHQNRPPLLKSDSWLDIVFSLQVVSVLTVTLTPVPTSTTDPTRLIYTVI